MELTPSRDGVSHLPNLFAFTTRSIQLVLSQQLSLTLDEHLAAYMDDGHCQYNLKKSLDFCFHSLFLPFCLTALSRAAPGDLGADLGHKYT